MSAQQVNSQECPICMEIIEGLCNRVVTECGHSFHCSCLMQNTAHNGFGCPYCRTKMADELAKEEDEYDDDEYINDEESTVFQDDALTSFRMFHQQLNGEEVEEEPPSEEWVSDDEDDEDAMPDSAYVVQKLSERGITFEDLVKNILFQDYGESYFEYERRSFEVCGQFNAIISHYY